MAADAKPDPKPDPTLIAFLRERDAPCPVCSYNLRGLAASKCPECAAPLHLEVGSSSLRLGPLVLAIVSFALAAGFDLIVGGFFAVGSLMSSIRGSLASWLGPALVAGVLGAAGLGCLAGIVLLVRRRAWWNRLGRRRQWAAAWTTFACVGVGHAVLGAVLFAVLA
ncbi:MAG: hypothetical protein KDA05_08285 [Phycisphaerales bacterium]|nr:hypothetical protein [Phycisphaerales bacterium]